MGKKNKKNRQESRRRYSEKKHRYCRLFDLTSVGIALLIIISMVISECGQSSLSEDSCAGFVKWFLVVVGYLPIAVYSVGCYLCGVAANGAIWENARILGALDIAFLVVWGSVRFIGRNYSPDFTRRAWHLLLIVFYWGIFQLFCFATALLWSDISCRNTPVEGSGSAVEIEQKQ